jgi:flagellar biosynthesis chaperone FliJ
MICKTIKFGILTVAGAALIGGAVFGRDLYSYISSGSHIIRTSVKESVPVEFQLARARDLVNDIVPEMQANVRLVAQQEVEIANLQDEIKAAHQSLDNERTKLTKLRNCLSTQDVSFTLGGVTYSRDDVKRELARKLELVRESDVVLSGKDRLLENRQKSLAAAMQVLERTRSEKALLESQIASLDSQNRLVQAASVGSGSSIDTSKLAQTQQLIAQIKKQLDVSERVLAHESRFVEPMVIDTLDEKDVTRQADEYLAGKPAPADKQASAAH